MEYHSGPLFNLLAANTASLQQDSGLLILMFILLFLSFVIAGSEVAFFSLSYKDIQVLKTKNYKPFQRIVALLEEPKKLLSSMPVSYTHLTLPTNREV